MAQALIEYRDSLSLFDARKLKGRCGGAPRLLPPLSMWGDQHDPIQARRGGTLAVECGGDS